MSHRRRPPRTSPLPLLRMLVLLSVGVLALAGCGSTAQVQATALPTATNLPITVTVDHTSYNIAQPIGVTVANTGKNVEYATDNYFACTIVMLQRYDTTAHQWQTLDACGAGHRTQAYLLPVGISEPFTLTPQSGTKQNGAKQSDWQTGTYRVGVRYSSSSDGISKASTAYSAGFSIT